MEEREHELGEGGQKRQEISEHHRPNGEVSDASGNEPSFEGPADGQPDDAASQLGGETASQAASEDEKPS